MSTNPDYVYNPDNWEVTYDWSDRGELEEDLDLDIGAIAEVGTMIQGPRKYLVHLVRTLDDRGDPDETEIVWFDTKEEALKALAEQPRAD